MALVRRAQQLHDGLGRDTQEVAERLGIPVPEVAKHIAYPTHFFSVYDLADWDEDNDVFDYIAEDRADVPPEETVYRRVQMECLRELLHKLQRKTGISSGSATAPSDIRRRRCGRSPCTTS